MSTRREDLAAALTNVEENDGELAADFVPPSGMETEQEVVTPTVEGTPTDAPVEASGERPRDASGRFAPKQPVAPDANAVAGQTPVEQQRPDVPKSWKAEYRDAWGALDPKVAAYVAQREQEMSSGIEKFRTENEPALSLYQHVAPYMQDAQQRGLSAQQFVADAKDLFHTRDLLMKSDPQTKLQTIVNIAHAAGLPLGQMLQGQMSPEQQQAINPQVMALQQRIQQLEGNWNQQAEQQQQQVQQQIDSDIAAFAADSETHPHFQALAPVMGQLIQAGLANDLDSAYSKALRMNDDLWQQEQARQRQSAEQQSRAQADKAAKAAKANAVSTRSATPGAVAATTGGAPKGRRAALEEAFSQATTSRI